jgi:outer membrane protein TolC
MLAEAARSREGYLERSFLPRVESFLGTEAFRMGTQPVSAEPIWRVDASVNLYNGGRDTLEEKLRAGFSRALTLDAEKDFAQELLSARKAYFEALSIAQLITIEESLLRLYEQHERRAARKFASGLTTESDMLQFDIAKKKTAQELKKLRGHANVVRTQLALLTGMQDHTKIEIPQTVEHPAEDDLKDETIHVDQIAEVAAIRERGTLLAMEASRQRASWYPQIDVYSSLVQFTSRDREVRPPRERQEWAIGIRLKMDLGDGWGATKEAHGKALMAAASDTRADHRTAQILSLEHELRHELDLFHELMHDADQNIEQAEKALRLTLDEYERGLKNGPDVLQASQSLMETKRLATLHKRDYYLKRCELLSLLAR